MTIYTCDSPVSSRISFVVPSIANKDNNPWIEVDMLCPSKKATDTSTKTMSISTKTYSNPFGPFFNCKNIYLPFTDCFNKYWDGEIQQNEAVPVKISYLLLISTVYSALKGFNRYHYETSFSAIYNGIEIKIPHNAETFKLLSMSASKTFENWAIKTF